MAPVTPSSGDKPIPHSRSAKTPLTGLLSLQIGHVEYPLFKPLREIASVDDLGKHHFGVEGLPAFAGTGPTFQKSRTSWHKQFHATFQKLFTMRPFEMNALELSLWQTICEAVDVECYRARLPLKLLQQGQVSRARNYPREIQWEEGTRERVDLKLFPDEFAAYPVGQRFEALAHRNATTYSLLKIEYLKRLPPLPRLSEEESRRLEESIPTSATLSDTTWE